MNTISRILGTTYDSYPKDRMLPQHTVYNLFLKIYEQENEKTNFLNNHTPGYLKLREGYSSLFIAQVFEEIFKREYFIIFPSDDKVGDVGVISEKERGSGEMEIIFFDIKEYLEVDSKDFDDYIEHIFSKQKIADNVYGLIITLNRDVVLQGDLLLKIKNKSKELSRGIFILASDPVDSYNINKGFCTYFLNGEIVYHGIAEISNQNNEEILIYQDEINYIDKK